VALVGGTAVEESKATRPTDRKNGRRVADLRKVPLARLGDDHHAQDLVNNAIGGEGHPSLVIVAGFQAAVS
jgi:hypothetical protein